MRIWLVSYLWSDNKVIKKQQSKVLGHQKFALYFVKMYFLCSQLLCWFCIFFWLVHASANPSHVILLATVLKFHI